jgi:hypothetical protein
MHCVRRKRVCLRRKRVCVRRKRVCVRRKRVCVRRKRVCVRRKRLSFDTPTPPYKRFGVLCLWDGNASKRESHFFLRY